MEGILITCNMNERKCTAEAFNLLNEYADKLYGPEKVSPAAPQCSLLYISAFVEEASITSVVYKQSSVSSVSILLLLRDLTMFHYN